MYRVQRFSNVLRQFTAPLRQRTFCCTRNDAKSVPIYRRKSLFDDVFDDRSFSWPSRLINQQMRMMDRIVDEVMPSRFSRWWTRPWWDYDFSVIRPEKDIKVEYNNKLFEIKLDVTDFEPSDLKVKIAGDRLSVSGKHSEKKDEHGFISREFTRQFVIPENVDAESIESLYSGDALVIRGKVKGSENVQERVIDIKAEPKTDEAKK